MEGEKKNEMKIVVACANNGNIHKIILIVRRSFDIIKTVKIELPTENKQNKLIALNDLVWPQLNAIVILSKLKFISFNVFKMVFYVF